MLHYFEIHVPIRDNSGVDTFKRREEFARRLMIYAGGLNTFNTYGNWTDETGAEYPEAIAVYRVAKEGNADLITRELRAMAKQVFEDQKTIFVAQIGTATIE